ncbi:TPA: hypothetical protein ACH3X1_015879 [Trebouxia sp. C0004]
MYMYDRTKSASGRSVWTPSASRGKPFPARRVPIEVWGIGAFNFKGIQGVSQGYEFPDLNQ